MESVVYPIYRSKLCSISCVVLVDIFKAFVDCNSRMQFTEVKKLSERVL